MTTPKAALPELSNSGSQYLTANTSFAIIDQMMNPVVVDKDLTGAPGSPTDGALYIMASAWSGVALTPGSAAIYAGRLIFWRSSANAWTVVRPWVGMRVAVMDEADANGVGKVYGCVTSLAGGAATWSLPESALINPMTTVGDIIVGGSSGAPTRLAAGTATYVLTSQGPGVAPSYQPASSGSGLTLTSKSANYTMVLGDANTGILHPTADTTARTFTLPANSSVPYPLGTAISFRNQNGAGVVTIAINTDTLRWAPFGTTGSRSLAANGVATAVKETATEWFITGVGLS